MVIVAGLVTDLYSVEFRDSVASVEVSGEVRTSRRPLSVSERMGGPKNSSGDVKFCAVKEVGGSINAILLSAELVGDCELSSFFPSSST